MRGVPRTGLCPICRAPVIDAVMQGETIRLDAASTPNAQLQARHTGTHWIAEARTPDFRGMPRAQHQCPDTQLELGA